MLRGDRYCCFDGLQIVQSSQKIRRGGYCQGWLSESIRFRPRSRSNP